jgi:hypothetical protein
MSSIEGSTRMVPVFKTGVSRDLERRRINKGGPVPETCEGVGVDPPVGAQRGGKGGGIQ